MRLSTAMDLGRTLGIAWDTNLFLSCDGKRGCAIGMALAAVDKRFNELEQTWPWLSQMAGRCHDYRAEIGERFRQVVRGTLTFDELIDYVRSIEPAEAEQVREEQPCVPVHCER